MARLRPCCVLLILILVTGCLGIAEPPFGCQVESGTSGIGWNLAGHSASSMVDYAWSPSSEQIVLRNPAQEIYIISDIMESPSQQFIATGIRPMWFPDEKAISFSNTTNNAPLTLYVFDFESGTTTQTILNEK